MNKKDLIEKIMEEYIIIEDAVSSTDTFVEEIRGLLEKHLPETEEVEKEFTCGIQNKCGHYKTPYCNKCNRNFKNNID